jgi:hypothetical protein
VIASQIIDEIKRLALEQKARVVRFIGQFEAARLGFY